MTLNSFPVHFTPSSSNTTVNLNQCFATLQTKSSNSHSEPFTLNSKKKTQTFQNTVLIHLLIKGLWEITEVLKIHQVQPLRLKVNSFLQDIYIRYSLMGEN